MRCLIPVIHELIYITVKAVYRHPACLTYIQSISCEVLGWMNYKVESRLPGEVLIASDMQMTPPL